MEPEKNYFGKTLKELRKRDGRKQYELANLIGKTPATWSLYESGKAIPNLDIIIIISEALKIDCLVLCWMAIDRSKYSDSSLYLSVEEYETIKKEGVDSLRRKKKQERIRYLRSLG